MILLVSSQLLWGRWWWPRGAGDTGGGPTGLGTLVRWAGVRLVSAARGSGPTLVSLTPQ